MAPGFSYGRMMTNAGRSYSAGVETTLHGAAFDNHLDWGLSYSFTRAKFKEYIDQQIVGGVSVALDYGGNHVPYVPWHQLAVLADYRFDIGTSWLRNIIVGAHMKAQGSQQLFAEVLCAAWRPCRCRFRPRKGQRLGAKLDPHTL